MKLRSIPWYFAIKGPLRELPPTPPGPPGSKLKVVRKTRIHAGPQAACRVCSPETAGAVIAQLERLRKRQEGRNTR